MSWKNQELGELTLYVKRGVSPKYVLENGIPIVNQRCIRENTINFDTTRLSSKEKKITDVKFLQIGDTVINSTGVGTLGRTAYVKKLEQPSSADTHVTIVRPDKTKVDSKFLSLYLNSKEDVIENMGKGATGQTELSAKDLSKHEVYYPSSLQTQKRIADILSSYDDLIENNLKRIKLLEQAAQNIYKEWFVNLRFPGHKNEVINEETGLPEGWTERNINEVFNIKYGKNLPATKITGSGRYTVYGASGVMGYYDKCNTEIKVALITSRGNGSGDVHRTFQKNTFVTNNSFKVFPKVGYEFYPFFFVTEFLKTLNLTNYCSGSAQPQLTNASMNNIRSIFPNKEKVDLFSQKVSPILEQSDVLLKQNQKLKAARDILLPRLMNRTIEV